ncbi:hypothetical protein EDD18DRAFT_1110673 [Armillaria luteobubalina]|uniref:Uncharacterized protein n=1 Tax=Armillaria luteobubalina TaxID=153913 RepID=A0AA39PQQ2_9AGAR|nr:hypothetical protein EDD18DRAFT_1110673 [Armillaria luteobubalina]
MYSCNQHEVEEDEEERPFVASLLPPSSPHTLEEEGNHHVCKLCHGGDKCKKNRKDKIYSIKTGTTGLQYHLIKDHLQLWIAACDKMGVSVKDTGIRAAERLQHENSTAKFKEGPLSIDFAVPDYSYDAFVEWIITDDQSINVIECLQLR